MFVINIGGQINSYLYTADNCRALSVNHHIKKYIVAVLCVTYNAVQKISYIEYNLRKSLTKSSNFERRCIELLLNIFLRFNKKI